MKKKNLVLLVFALIFCTCLIIYEKKLISNGLKNNLSNTTPEDQNNVITTWNPNHINTNITFKRNGDGCDEYVFINQSDGWKAYTEATGAGQIMFDLYNTSDGGKQWTKIDISDKSEFNGGDFIFINKKIGWITTQISMDGVLELFKTSDGGITWNPQYINVPSKYSNNSFTPYMPIFFSEKDGIIFARSRTDSNNVESIKTFAFITHDSGETWSFNSNNVNDEDFSWSCTLKDDTISKFEVIYDNEPWFSIDGIVWDKSNKK
ncbi:WD40/YVTN/BNR-like repeat-containing protein [Anaerosporobacter sp.]